MCKAQGEFENHGRTKKKKKKKKPAGTEKLTIHVPKIYLYITTCKYEIMMEGKNQYVLIELMQLGRPLKKAM